MMIDLVDIKKGFPAETFSDKASYYIGKFFFGKRKAKKIREEKRYLKKLRAFRDLISEKQKVNLNLGCGEVYLSGWINIDNRNDDVKLDLRHDLSRGLPFDDNSVDFIFNEHFLEHLTPEQGVTLLKECYRVLKVGGVLRVAMPHIKPVIDRYYNDKWHEEPWLKKYGCDWIKTKAEVVNIGFRAWGHQWLYDEEELERRLKEASFSVMYAVRNGESDYQELKNMETREGSELIYEAVKS